MDVRGHGGRQGFLKFILFKRQRDRDKQIEAGTQKSSIGWFTPQLFPQPGTKSEACNSACVYYFWGRYPSTRASMLFLRVLISSKLKSNAQPGLEPHCSHMRCRLPKMCPHHCAKHLLLCHVWRNQKDDRAFRCSTFGSLEGKSINK